MAEKSDPASIRLCANLSVFLVDVAEAAEHWTEICARGGGNGHVGRDEYRIGIDSLSSAPPEPATAARHASRHSLSLQHPDSDLTAASASRWTGTATPTTHHTYTTTTTANPHSTDGITPFTSIACQAIVPILKLLLSSADAASHDSPPYFVVATFSSRPALRPQHHAHLTVSPAFAIDEPAIWKNLVRWIDAAVRKEARDIVAAAARNNSVAGGRQRRAHSEALPAMSQLAHSLRSLLHTVDWDWHAQVGGVAALHDSDLTLRTSSARKRLQLLPLLTSPHHPPTPIPLSARLFVLSRAPTHGTLSSWATATATGHTAVPDLPDTAKLEVLLDRTQDALLGKDGAVWARCAEIGVGMSWIDTAGWETPAGWERKGPLEENSGMEHRIKLHLSTILASLSGTLIPLPSLLLPRFSLLRFSDYFPTLVPAAGNSEWGRVLVKGRRRRAAEALDAAVVQGRRQVMFEIASTSGSAVQVPAEGRTVGVVASVAAKAPALPGSASGSTAPSPSPSPPQALRLRPLRRIPIPSIDPHWLDGAASQPHPSVPPPSQPIILNPADASSPDWISLSSSLRRSSCGLLCAAYPLGSASASSSTSTAVTCCVVVFPAPEPWEVAIARTVPVEQLPRILAETSPFATKVPKEDVDDDHGVKVDWQSVKAVWEEEIQRIGKASLRRRQKAERTSSSKGNDSTLRNGSEDGAVEAALQQEPPVHVGPEFIVSVEQRDDDKILDTAFATLADALSDMSKVFDGVSSGILPLSALASSLLSITRRLTMRPESDDSQQTLDEHYPSENGENRWEPAEFLRSAISGLDITNEECTSAIKTPQKTKGSFRAMSVEEWEKVADSGAATGSLSAQLLLHITIVVVHSATHCTLPVLHDPAPLTPATPASKRQGHLRNDEMVRLEPYLYRIKRYLRKTVLKSIDNEDEDLGREEKGLGHGGDDVQGSGLRVVHSSLKAYLEELPRCVSSDDEATMGVIETITRDVDEILGDSVGGVDGMDLASPLAPRVLSGLEQQSPSDVFEANDDFADDSYDRVFDVADFCGFDDGWQSPPRGRGYSALHSRSRRKTIHHDNRTPILGDSWRSGGSAVNLTAYSKRRSVTTSERGQTGDSRLEESTGAIKGRRMEQRRGEFGPLTFIEFQQPKVAKKQGLKVIALQKDKQLTGLSGKRKREQNTEFAGFPNTSLRSKKRKAVDKTDLVIPPTPVNRKQSAPIRRNNGLKTILGSPTPRSRRSPGKSSVLKPDLLVSPTLSRTLPTRKLGVAQVVEATNTMEQLVKEGSKENTHEAELLQIRPRK
ncbi:hypothetical protein M427DRAFT_66925, partial [Gonapodya prolifera JEL478]